MGKIDPTCTVRGSKDMGSMWTCPDCGKRSTSTTGYCSGCGISKSLANDKRNIKSSQQHVSISSANASLINLNSEE